MLRKKSEEEEVRKGEGRREAGSTAHPAALVGFPSNQEADGYELRDGD